MNNNIPTAEEILAKITPVTIEGIKVYGKEVVLSMMKLNAKLHVKAAIKAILKKSTITIEETTDPITGETYIDKVIDKNSIINSYPLDQIK